jgi:hypothetical protein
LNILTFNWHAPYVCMLARLPHQFLVVEPEIAPGTLKRWEKFMRPLPSNARLVTPDEAGQVLDSREWIWLSHIISRT